MKTLTTKTQTIIKSVLLFCLAVLIVTVPLKGSSVTSLKPAALSPIIHPERILSTQLIASQAIPPSSLAQTSTPSTTPSTQIAKAYVPEQEVYLADPSNYGDRYATDAYGKPVYNNFIVVLHETVGDAWSAINYFQAFHSQDYDQASYHAIIRRNGNVVYTVPPEKRAYGAGNSIFKGPNGPEAVITNKEFPPSVNNFAYHISLETPSDGRGDSLSHSGYTSAQYKSLAWLIAQTTIPENRITTHRDVDRSTSRIDPRSFDRARFLKHLGYYSRQVG